MSRTLASVMTFVALVVYVVPTATNATTLLTPSRTVTPQNSRTYGIEVHVLKYDANCYHGLQFWISAPREATSAHLQFYQHKTYEEYEAIDVEPQIVELPPNAELEAAARNSYEPESGASAWFEERRTKLGFLAKGFRGVSFCLKADLIPLTTFEYRAQHEFWDLGNLGTWYTSP